MNFAPLMKNYENKSKALRLKLDAIASILVASAVGVYLLFLEISISALRPEKDMFFVDKAFAAGVILATGMIHVFPDAFDNLSWTCLKENPWEKFPFAGFVAMVSAIGTLMIDAFATGYYKRCHFNRAGTVPDEKEGDLENNGVHANHVHVDTHGTHGHSHGSAILARANNSSDLVRHRIISHV